MSSGQSNAILAAAALMVAGCVHTQTPLPVQHAAAEARNSASDSLVITITRDERILYRGVPVSLEHLAATLRRSGVRADAALSIRADHDVRWGFVARVLDALHEYGVGQRIPLLA